MFRYAIVRPPGKNFSQGLTTANLGEPHHLTALKQHSDYCRALQKCGVTVTTLSADDRYPDSTFVEDTAIVTRSGAIITRPGAVTRREETLPIEQELSRRFDKVLHITDPGTLEGGDVCQVDDHFLIGVSERTNEDGAEQLAGFLSALGYTSELVEVRNLRGVLHLKSALGYLGRNRLVVIDELADLQQLRRFELVIVRAKEAYAANCVLINGTVLIARGFPDFAQQLQELGVETIELDMSEFEKMDGGLSCLSLRF